LIRHLNNFNSIIFYTLVITFISCGGDSTNKKPKLTEKNLLSAMEIVTPLVKEGWVRFDSEIYRVYIDPKYWSVCTIDIKETHTFAFAIYMAIQRKNLDYITADVYDNISGKKLAYYGSWGFKVY